MFECVRRYTGVVHYIRGLICCRKNLLWKLFVFVNANNVRFIFDFFYNRNHYFEL